MSTHALTVVVDKNGREILSLYRQSDGYITGHGADLARFLAGKRIVNGYSPSDSGKVFNTIGCLAAALVAILKIDNAETVRAYDHCKEDKGWYDVPNPNKGGARLGAIYIMAPGTKADDCSAEYTYTIREGKKMADGSHGIDVGFRREGDSRTLFMSAARFSAKVAKAEEMEELAHRNRERIEAMRLAKEGAK
jgi:hypothetical protein